MKTCNVRVWFTAAALVMAMALGGCNTNQEAVPEGGTPAQTESTQEAAPGTPAEPAPGDSAASAASPAAPAPPAPGGGTAAAPVIVVETERGTFEFETYPQDAPKTVAHIVALVKRNFFNGQRIHRVEPGFVIQFGDPLSRDMSQQYRWGTGGSGSPIGEAEIKRTHRVGAVAMAHAGNARLADSQMYVSLSTKATAQLDGDYTVFGQVISGMDVVQKIQPRDMIKRVTMKGAAPAAD